MDIITAQDFRLASCQATLFTPDEEVSSIKLIRGLLPKWTERFDAEPPSMPVADGLPRETPRLILESQSHVWRCQIASARIDLFWRKTIVDPSDITLDEFFRVAIQLLNEYQEFLGARVARIAAVLNRYAEHPTPGPFVAWHFCQERWFPPSHTDIESCELHVHKRFVLAEQFQVNLWVRSKTGALSAQGKHPIVLVDQNLNTLAEDMEEREFSKEDIERFFVATVPKFDKTLQLYYPVEG